MGTPGHMAHPFDVERVKTGQDLIDYINDAVLRLQNQEIGGSVKWDGINTSFKLITREDGQKEFRMDRGTSHIDSVIGFNAESALKKWGTEHGMTQAIVKLLEIFNSAIPAIEPELKELGMWDDPTKYFNTEYIEGKSNVQEYDQNILAIHGINQFYEKKAQPHAIRKGTSMDRPGLERPIDPDTGKPTKAGGIEIPYNKEALHSLIKKVEPIADEYGFEIYGDVPVEFNPEVELDLDKVLDIPVSVQITPGGTATHSLREWLQMVEHPQDKKIRRADGKSVGALSKDVYLAVLQSGEEGGVPLSQYLESKEDVKDAINGALMYHGTRLLGQAVKNALTSQAGAVGGHEGVVLRGMEDFLVKLTGDFIVQGLASTHGDQSKQGLAEEVSEKQVVAVYPGRFQPMGLHHFETYQKIAGDQGIDNTYVATSNKVGARSPLNFEEKKNIMKMHGVPEEQIVQAKNPYNVKELSDQFDPNDIEMVYFVGAKDMAEDPRFQKTSGVTKDGYEWRIAIAPHVSLEVPGFGEMSGTTLRQSLKGATPEIFEKIMGFFDQEIYDTLRNTLEEQGMAGGAVAGYAGRAPDVVGSEKKRKRPPKDFLEGSSEETKIRGNPTAAPTNFPYWAPDKDEKPRPRREDAKNEELVSEVVDYLLGIMVG